MVQFKIDTGESIPKQQPLYAVYPLLYVVKHHLKHMEKMGMAQLSISPHLLCWSGRKMELLDSVCAIVP